jgi:membrane protease YdiL (CAAX protease family)
MTPAFWLRHRLLLGYFAVAYGISWGGILVVLSFTGFDLRKLRPLDTGLIFIAMLLGPSTAGLASTALLDGRLGLHKLRLSIMRWRVRRRWYAVALLTMPVLLLAILWPLNATVDPAFAPRIQWPLFAIGLIAGCFEEIGWTGFATPALLARHRPFIAGLSLGLVWALWHVLVDFRQNFNEQGFAWLLEFAVFYIAALTAYRLLMTWVYAHTQSVLLAILMHASYTGWLLVLYPATSFKQGLVWETAFAVTLWLAVAVIFAGFVRHGLQRSGHPRSISPRAPHETAPPRMSKEGSAVALQGSTELTLKNCARSDERSTAPTDALKQGYAAIVLRPRPRETSKSAEM